MNWLRVLISRFSGMFLKTGQDRELDEELRGHLELMVEQNIRLGMPEAEARRKAQLSFGGIEQAKESYRQQRGVPVIETVLQDLRYGGRVLARNPGFTLVAVMTLALGIGANTAIFSMVQAVMLRPLPYHEPDRLVLLADSHDPAEGGIYLQDFQSWKSQNHSFEDMAVYYRDSGVSRVTLTAANEPESVQGAFVSANFFPLMGVAPALGRWFTSDEETARERVLILSHALWQRRFGAARDVIGKTLQIDGIDTKIIGVMPASFQFPAPDQQFWSPITINSRWNDPEVGRVNPARSRGFYARWQAVARLRPAVTVDAAQAEMNLITARLAQTDPDPNRVQSISIIPLRIDLSRSNRLAIFVLLGAVAAVLLIACSNVANLVLARGATREHEMAIRTALGAGRRRLMRQLFTESALLALLAALVGLGFALISIRALIAFGPADIPRLDEARLDGVVLVFTLTVSLFAAVLFGVIPAWRISRSNANDALKAGGKGAVGSVGLTSMRSLLVVTELALSVVLLTGAGLLVRSFLAVQAVDPGFRPERILTMSITMPSGAPPARMANLYDRALDRVSALPGVQAAGAINGLFELGSENVVGLRSIEGRTPEAREQWTALTWKVVRGDYFQAMGVPLIKGRHFSGQDGPDTPLVAIIDESMARRYWPNEDPIGKRFKGQDQRGRNDDWLTVIGVVRNMRREGPEKNPTPHIFQWYRQSEDGVSDLVVRTAGDPVALETALRKEVRAVDQAAILSSVMTIEQQLSEQLAPRRFKTWLLAVFSAIALLLSGVGTYGMMHYSVTQRRHEIGIRMALGARPRDVVLMVIRQALSLAIVGLGIGVMGAWWLTKLLTSLLYGVRPDDPVTFIAVSGLLTVMAILASSIPAWRAAKVDPLLALRRD